MKTHVSRAMTKLRARDRAQLVVFAFESGFVVPGPGTGRLTRSEGVRLGGAYADSTVAITARSAPAASTWPDAGLGGGRVHQRVRHGDQPVHRQVGAEDALVPAPLDQRGQASQVAVVVSADPVSRQFSFGSRQNRPESVHDLPAGRR